MYQCQFQSFVNKNIYSPMLATYNNHIVYSGYMAPEYALDGFFSIKSDVFSFGVVLLEILSGKRNTGFYQSKQISSLLGYVCFFKCTLITPVLVNGDMLSYNNFSGSCIRHGDYGQRISCWI